MKHQVKSSLKFTHLWWVREVTVFLTRIFRKVQEQEHVRIKVLKTESDKNLRNGA